MRNIKHILAVLFLIALFSCYDALEDVYDEINKFFDAVWARSVTAGADISIFYSVTTDSSGNLYAAGYQYGTGIYTYGTGVSVSGTFTDANVVLVKYDSSGNAVWARSVTAGIRNSNFRSVITDSSGNIYAAGYQYGTGIYTYGTGVSVSGTFTDANVVLVKYDSSGNAIWAKSVTAGADSSVFFSVATDSSGNIYAAGYQYGTGIYTYGTGVSVSGTYPGGSNVVLVKYNPSGNALWARSLTAGVYSSEFCSVATDSSGNIYAAGYQYGTGIYTYGTGVSVSGTYSGYNVVLVKYAPSGNAVWARSVTAGASFSQFWSVATDSSNNIYAAGFQTGTGIYTYGTGVSVSGTYSGNNVVLVKYDSSGNAIRARSVTAGIRNSQFRSVITDSSGNIYAAGFQNGTGIFTYGTGVSVSGAYPGGNNVVLVKYGYK